MISLKRHFEHNKITWVCQLRAISASNIVKTFITFFWTFTEIWGQKQLFIPWRPFLGDRSQREAIVPQNFRWSP